MTSIETNEKSSISKTNVLGPSRREGSLESLKTRKSTIFQKNNHKSQAFPQEWNENERFRQNVLKNHPTEVVPKPIVSAEKSGSRESDSSYGNILATTLRKPRAYVCIQLANIETSITNDCVGSNEVHRRNITCIAKSEPGQRMKMHHSPKKTKNFHEVP